MLPRLTVAGSRVDGNAAAAQQGARVGAVVLAHVVVVDDAAAQPLRGLDADAEPVRPAAAGPLAVAGRQGEAVVRHAVYGADPA